MSATSPSPAQPKMGNLPWTEGFRGIGCAFVVVWHAILTIYPVTTPGQPSWLIWPVGLVSREALLVFIVLSGFLLGRRWRTVKGENLQRFKLYILRRTWRILPPYWVALTLVILAMLLLGLKDAGGTHWDVGLPLTVERAVIDFLALSDLNGQVPLSHQFWTIPLEYHVYFGAALLIFLKPGWSLAIGAAVCAVGYIMLPDPHGPFLVFTFIVSFGVGSQRRDLTDIDFRLLARILAPVIVIGAAIVLVGTVTDRMEESNFRYFVVDAICTPLVLGWCLWRDVRPGGFISAFLSLKPLVWLGERSYSTYLVHAVVVELAYRFVVQPWLGDGDGWVPMIGIIAVGYLASVFVALWFFRWVEAPAARKSAAVGRAPSAPTVRTPA